MATNEKARVELEVEGKKAAEEMTRLEKKADELRKKFNEAFKIGDTKGIEQTTKELDKVNRQLQTMRTRAQNIDAAMKSLNTATPKELQRTIRLINSELNSGHVPRGSKQWKEYVEQLKRAKAELKRVNAEMSESKGLLSSLKDKFNDWGAAAAGAIAAFAGVVMSGKAAVQAYANMEQEEANVRKYTGMTAEEVAALNAEFKKLDTRTSREALNQLAQEAGRLGKQSQEDVLGFVKAANQLNVALDDLGEGATLTLSKLTGIFGDEQRLGTERSLLAVGSVINELSQNCTASAPYLANFAKRLAGVGAQANMTIPQIMAFAAVLDTQGQAVEMSATAFSQLILKLYKDPSKFAKAAGLDVKQFAELLSKDANEAVITLLESLNKMGNIEALAPIFKDMGMDGARASGVMAALAGNIDAVRAQQVEANKAFQEATSVTTEYNVQNNTVQAQLDKARKGFTEMAVSLGEKLLPVMRYCISGTSMLMRTIKVLVEFFIEWGGTIISATTAIVAYRIALSYATIATKVHNTWVATCTATKKAWEATTLLAAAAANLFTGNIRRATAAMRLFNSTTKANPVALIVSGLAAAIAALIVYTQKADKASLATRKIAEAEKEAAKQASAEMAETSALYKKTQDLNASMETRLAAANKLKEMHPETFKNLSAEAIVAGQAADAYRLLAENIQKTALASAYRQKLENNATELAEAETAKAELLERLKYNQHVGNILKQDVDEAEMIKQLVDWSESSEKWIANSYHIGGTTDNKENTRNMIKRLLKLNKSIDEYNEVASGIADKISSIEGSMVTSTPISTSPNEPTNNTNNASAEIDEESDPKKRIQKALDAEKERIDQEMALNAIAYTTGERDYESYINHKKILEMGLLDNQIQTLEDMKATDTKEYSELLIKRAELQAKYADDAKARSLAELEEQYDSEKSKLADMYADANSAMFLNDKAYKQALFEAEIEFLMKKLTLYKDNAKERAKIEKQIDNLVNKDRLEKEKEFQQKRKAFEQQYLTDKMDSYKKSLEAIDKLEADGVINAKEATHARMQELSKQLGSIGQDFSASLVALGDAIYAYANNLGTKIEDVVVTAFSVMSSALSQYSAYVKAEQDIELAKIEKRYDAEIEAAGNNKKKVSEIEKKKEAEIAATKKKYNDRAMKIEIAQAIAQTAQGAIAAYASAAAIPVTGWIMAPIAAALATAAGMMQVATIKKQHEAESAGYYEGGFTGGNDYRREAGVVHGGEFVANHHAVNNPELAPVLRLIDYAQRNNTVGSLTAEDVSIALAQGRGVSARGEAVRQSVNNTTVTNVIDVAPLDRLNDILDNGIEAFTVLDGERGLDRQYTRYKKLQNNPHR